MIDLATCQKCEKDWEAQIEQMMADNTDLEARIGELRQKLADYKLKYEYVEQCNRKNADYCVELIKGRNELTEKLAASEATISLLKLKLQIANGLVQRGDVMTMCQVLDGFGGDE
jgi:predicted RNase H-like nuclease (RuvC/YqgF family)